MYSTIFKYTYTCEDNNQKESGQKPFSSCANVFFTVVKEMTTSEAERELCCFVAVTPICKPEVLDSNRSYQDVQGLSLK